MCEVDPSGERESRLVGRSVQGDFAPAFATDGALLFLSGRENTDSAAEKSESRGVGLWALPIRLTVKSLVSMRRSRACSGSSIRAKIGGAPSACFSLQPANDVRA